MFGRLARWRKDRVGGTVWRPRRDIAVVPPRRHDGVVERNAHGDVNIVVCETDYKALKRGIQHLPPAVH